jgi:hypothetical protein
MYASGRRTTSSLNKFYSRLVSLKTADRILTEAKKLRQSWNISKETALRREHTILGTTFRHSTTVPYFPCYWFYQTGYIFSLLFRVTLPCASQSLTYASPNGGKSMQILLLVYRVCLWPRNSLYKKKF